MKTLKNMTGDSLEQMIDYKVVDQNGDSIGTLHSLWSDPTTGAVEFLGVKTGWLFGQNHVVPAEKAELDESANVVRLPYTEPFIKEAPAISAEAEISEEQESEIYRYYGLDRGSDTLSDQPTGTSFGTGAGHLPEAIGAGTVAGAGEAGISGVASGGGSGDTTLGAMSRLRRTSRPDAGATGASIAGTASSREIDDIGPTDASARASVGNVEPGSFATANMFGSTGRSTASVAGDSAGARMLDPMEDVSDPLEDRLGSNVTDPGDENMGLRHAHGTNADPVTGEPGAHPVGTGAGALAAGAAGGAIGAAIGGPVGAPVGAVIGVVAGAIGGGFAGKGIAESINPTEEDAYWRSNYQSASYHEPGFEYSDYSPAYRVGYEGYGRYAGSGQDFNDVEGNLAQEYQRSSGDSRLTWDKAKAATRDAWDRLKTRTNDAERR